MRDIRAILSNYFDILEEGRTAKFQLCKNTPVSFKKSNSLKKLWKNHNETKLIIHG